MGLTANCKLPPLHWERFSNFRGNLRRYVRLEICTVTYKGVTARARKCWKFSEAEREV